MPRKRSKGGPYVLYACPGCRRKSRVERNRAGALLAGPIPIVPVADAFFASFDADLRADLARKRAYEKKRKGRRRWFFDLYADELWAAGVRPNNVAGKRQRPRPEPEPPPRREPPPRAGPAPEPPPEAAPPPPPEVPPTPHELLGVDPGAGQEVVTKAFRELAKRYHPDRFEALDEEFRALAHKKFLQLKLAYDELIGE